MASPTNIVIATRRSRLALWQAEHVKGLIEQLYPTQSVSLLSMSTRGDEVLDQSLARIGGKGLFVKELEAALADGRAHLAVHSAKDVPMALPLGFDIAAILAREDPRDAFVSNRFGSLDAMPAGSFVGTSSLRREAQLRERYPRLNFAPLRGNVETRLAKLDGGACDAAILAVAGLVRLGLADRIRMPLSTAVSLPAPGQGALAVEVHERQPDVRAALISLNDHPSACCVRAERAVSKALGGSCQLPLAAHATYDGDRLRLQGLLAMPDGSRVIRAEVAGSSDDPEALGAQLAIALQQAGAQAILDRLSKQAE